jgi:hypothetical protein
LLLAPRLIAEREEIEEQILTLHAMKDSAVARVSQNRWQRLSLQRDGKLNTPK